MMNRKRLENYKKPTGKLLIGTDWKIMNRNRLENDEQKQAGKE